MESGAAVAPGVLYEFGGRRVRNISPANAQRPKVRAPNVPRPTCRRQVLWVINIRLWALDPESCLPAKLERRWLSADDYKHSSSTLSRAHCFRVWEFYRGAWL